MKRIIRKIIVFYTKICIVSRDLYNSNYPVLEKFEFVCLHKCFEKFLHEVIWKRRDAIYKYKCGRHFEIDLIASNRERKYT